MSVPDSDSFDLISVTIELGGGETSLQECFDNAIPGGFDPLYEGSKNSLLNFRNYEHIEDTMFINADVPAGQNFIGGQVFIKSGATLPEYTIDWGDGNLNTYVSGSFFAHTYLSAYNGVIKISNIDIYILRQFTGNSFATSISISGLYLLETFEVTSSLQFTTIDLSKNTLLSDVTLDYCSLSQASVDNIFIDLNNHGLLNGVISIVNGNSASPSSTSLSARNSLISKGWSITTN
jgi:hypothetical protein